MTEPTTTIELEANEQYLTELQTAIQARINAIDSDLTTTDGDREYLVWLLQDVTAATDELQTEQEDSELTDRDRETLPEISDVAVETDEIRILFGNDAILRYGWDGEEVREEVFMPDDPHSVWRDVGLGIGPDGMYQVALESVAEYLVEYQTNPGICEGDWPRLYEVLTAGQETEDR